MHKKLSAFDNIPLLSWLLLRGRCRYCRRPIAVRYPLLELFLMLMGITPAWRLGIGVDWFFMLVLVALLLALAAIDNQCQLLPDCLTLSLLWIGLLWHCLAHPAFCRRRSLARWRAIWRSGYCIGDFVWRPAARGWDTAISNCWRRLAPGGYAALPSILLFASAGSLLWLLLRAWRGGDVAQPLPFGPGLATAGAGAVACQWLALPIGG